MRIRVGYGNANIASLHVVRKGSEMTWTVKTYLTMRVILTKACTASADTAVWAVIDLFPCIVIPELADITVVARRLDGTVLASVGCLLRRPTRHAQHILRSLAVQCVIFDFIVAVSTCVPASTVVALYLHIALVVLTAQYELLFVIFLVVLVVSVFDRPVCWASVAWPQLVGILDVDVRRNGERRRRAVLGEDRVSRVGREGTIVRDEAARRGRAHVVVPLGHQAMDHLCAFLLGEMQRSDLVDARAQVGEAIVGGQRLGHAASISACSAGSCAWECSGSSRRTGDGRVEIKIAEAMAEGAGRVRRHASCIGWDVYWRSGRAGPAFAIVLVVFIDHDIVWPASKGRIPASSFQQGNWPGACSLGCVARCRDCGSWIVIASSWWCGRRAGALIGVVGM